MTIIQETGISMSILDCEYETERTDLAYRLVIKRRTLGSLTDP